jgi:hypothetical protein
VRAAGRYIRESFRQVPVNDRLRGKSNLAILNARFKKIADTHVRQFPDAPRNHDLKFGFDRNEFHLAPVHQSYILTVALTRRASLINASGVR